MRRLAGEKGVALVSALLVLMMMSAMLAGFLVMINADQAAGGIDRDQTQAYAAAHAGVEKLTADLWQLFNDNFSPNAEDLEALTVSAKEPQLRGITYIRPDLSSGYRISFLDENGDGVPDIDNEGEGVQIEAGDRAGLVGLITKYDVEVTARTVGKAEVQMRRQMQTIAIPIFQFGIFSENDLSFFAGPDFNFGGRVHSNQSVYLKQDGTATLTLADKVTAVREVVRSHLSNGVYGSHGGNVRMSKGPNCPDNTNDCRLLGATEGSINLPTSTITAFPIVPNNTDPIKNTNWVNLSQGTYQGYIRNWRTGARPLVLPIATGPGATPADLIRRPRENELETSNTYRERFFHLASLRILLSDSEDEITDLPSVTGTPINLADAAVASLGGIPLAKAGTDADGYKLAAGSALHGGYILIERKRDGPNGPYEDVTMEILNKGVTGRNLAKGTRNVLDTGVCSALPEPNPGAIIRIQRVRDNPINAAAPCGRDGALWSQEVTDYWPNVLFDPREGSLRDSHAQNQTTVKLGGVMHYVELDVANLKLWLEDQADIMKTTGYVVYFSDRRGDKNDDDEETGEFGFEDLVNLNDQAQGIPNGVPEVGEDINADGELDPGEDANGNGTLDPGEDVGNGSLEGYGNTPRYSTYGGAEFAAPLNRGVAPGLTGLGTQVSINVARVNPPIFFRRALKLRHGDRLALLGDAEEPLGLTIASENPVYVQGDFNANTAEGVPDTYDLPHVPAAVLADAVTLLSNSWNDLDTFRAPYSTTENIEGATMRVPGDPGAAGSNLPNPRQATTTTYRMAVLSGKGRSFPRPDDAVNHNDYGTDGGAHNFLRYIERWTGAGLNYKGSIVSLFFSRQAVGTYKCCDNVYQPPTRGYTFDDEFLSPANLPPRTPMFRDLNTLTFRQILRPTQ